MLEVLTERSTDGRSTGRNLAVREGGEVRHKRPAVGKVKSDPATDGMKHARDLSSQSMSTEGRQTVWTARPSGRPGRCSRCWVPVASAEALVRTWFLPRNRMSELFTYGSVGGVGYSPGGNSGVRPAPTRKGTPQPYLPSVVMYDGWLRRTSKLAEWAPLIFVRSAARQGVE